MVAVAHSFLQDHLWSIPFPVMRSNYKHGIITSGCHFKSAPDGSCKGKEATPASVRKIV